MSTPSWHYTIGKAFLLFIYLKIRNCELQTTKGYTCIGSCSSLVCQGLYICPVITKQSQDLPYNLVQLHPIYCTWNPFLYADHHQVAERYAKRKKPSTVSHLCYGMMLSKNKSSYHISSLIYIYIYIYLSFRQVIDKRNILAVQTLRNMIMGSTLMATTLILLCAGLATVISSTYSVQACGARVEFMIALKYFAFLILFLFSFFMHSMFIKFTNQVVILINTMEDPQSTMTKYVSDVLEKGFLLNTVGNRVFYIALPLLLWIFGPMLVFFCFVTMVLILYILDFVLVCK